MIEVANVSFSYGSHQVIRAADFSVAQGELLTISGESGCGKSTMLNIVAGLLKPSSGSVNTGGAGIGYVFQGDLLIPWMSAAGNITFVLGGLMSRKEAAEAALYRLEQLGMYGDRNRYPGSMSGGMRKRVNIARALAVNPGVLLLDEPFAHLDRGNRELAERVILEEVRERRCAAVLVSHDPEDIGYEPVRRVSISELPAVIRG